MPGEGTRDLMNIQPMEASCDHLYTFPDIEKKTWSWERAETG